MSQREELPAAPPEDEESTSEEIADQGDDAMPRPGDESAEEVDLSVVRLLAGAKRNFRRFFSRPPAAADRAQEGTVGRNSNAKCDKRRRMSANTAEVKAVMSHIYKGKRHMPRAYLSSLLSKLEAAFGQEDNYIPSSFHTLDVCMTRDEVSEAGPFMERIPCCARGCMLFRGESRELKKCNAQVEGKAGAVCGEERFDRGGTSKAEVIYFPLRNRLYHALHDPVFSTALDSFRHQPHDAPTPEIFRDVWDGSEWQTFLRFADNHEDCTVVPLAMTSDGVGLYKTLNSRQFYHFTSVFLGLPKHLRVRHDLLHLHCLTGKNCTTNLLIPLVEELLALSRPTKFTLKTGESVKVVVYFAVSATDLRAEPKFTGRRQAPSLHGACGVCPTVGAYNDNRIFYPPPNNPSNAPTPPWSSSDLLCGAVNQAPGFIRPTPLILLPYYLPARSHLPCWAHTLCNSGKAIMQFACGYGPKRIDPKPSWVASQKDIERLETHLKGALFPRALFSNGVRSLAFSRSPTPQQKDRRFADWLHGMSDFLVFHLVFLCGTERVRTTHHTVVSALIEVARCIEVFKRYTIRASLAYETQQRYDQAMIVLRAHLPNEKLCTIVHHLMGHLHLCTKRWGPPSALWTMYGERFARVMRDLTDVKNRSIISIANSYKIFRSTAKQLTLSDMMAPDRMQESVEIVLLNYTGSHYIVKKSQRERLAELFDSSWEILSRGVFSQAHKIQLNGVRFNSKRYDATACHSLCFVRFGQNIYVARFMFALCWKPRRSSPRSQQRTAIRVRCLKTTPPRDPDSKILTLRDQFTRFRIEESANAGAADGEFVAIEQLLVSNVLAIPKEGRFGLPAVGEEYWALNLDCQYN